MPSGHARAAFALLACSILSGVVSAQSNVRPAPRLVRVPEMGARLLGRERRDPAASLRTRTPSSARELAAFVSEEPAQVGFTYLGLSGTAHDNAGFERGGGDVAIVRGAWSGVFGTLMADEKAVALSLDAEASFYDFSGATALMGGSPDPFNDVYDSRLGLTVLGDPALTRTWFAGMEVGLAGEDDADLRQALTVGGVGGLRLRLSDETSVSLGLAVRSRLEDDPWVFPYLGFDLAVSDRVRLLAEGSHVRAVFEATDAVELALGAKYELRQFRLNGDSSLPDGVVRDEEIDTTASLTWSVSDTVSVRFDVGANVWRELSSYGRDGGRIAEVETESSMLAGFELSVTL